jgi:halimadienyl-diphosphate synthase
MSTFEDVHDLLARAGSNVVRSTAYDTAMLAATSAEGVWTAHAAPRFPESLEWLTTHQNHDGSWGGPWPHYHDRLLSTLRAVLTLSRSQHRRADIRATTAGIRYIWLNANRLPLDPYETVAFELIFPTLLAEARLQGLELPYGAFDHVLAAREDKLARAGFDLMYRRDTPLATSLEALGPMFESARARNLQEASGAVGISPAATAYLLQKQPHNEAAVAYFQRVLRDGPRDGGVPSCYPIETFERAWTLYHLQHARPRIHAELPDVGDPLVAFLHRTLRPDGWATSEFFTIKESDSTALCFAVLHRAGYTLDPQLIYQYEEADHFRCYPFERNPSISANIHVLDALHFCAPAERAPRVEKIVRFLRRVRQPEGFWFDKWHASPYYATGHAILAAYDFAPDLVRPAVTWLRHTQYEHGGWGFYAPTVEETAYALLALLAWRAAGHEVPDDVLERGADYLHQYFAPERGQYPPLWIGKTLYVPVQVVQSAALAALLAYRDWH